MTHRRKLILLSFILILALAFGLYHIKYQVMALEDRLARAENAIAEEEESLRVLTAEWEYLASPSSLQARAEAHTNLHRVAPEQVAHYETLGEIRPPSNGHDGSARLVSYEQ